MKCFLFVCLFYSTILLGESTNWETQIYTSEIGSCKTGNLNFSALRFTKIPINSDLHNQFLRVILFIRPNNTVAMRLTIQELLSCKLDSSGSEICSYRPITNQWFESSWSKNESIQIPDLGNIFFDGKTSEISIIFKPDFSLPEVAGKSFEGHMVLVNFNDHGVNTSNICKPLQNIIR